MNGSQEGSDVSSMDGLWNHEIKVRSWSGAELTLGEDLDYDIGLLDGDDYSIIINAAEAENLIEWLTDFIERRDRPRGQYKATYVVDIGESISDEFENSLWDELLRRLKHDGGTHKQSSRTVVEDVQSNLKTITLELL